MIELNHYVKGKSLEDILSSIRTITFDQSLSELVKQTRSGDKTAEQKYVLRYIPYIVSLIRLYRDRGYTDLELISLSVDELLRVVEDPALPLGNEMELLKYGISAIKAKLGSCHALDNQ